MLPAENLDNKIKEFWPKNGPPTQEIEKYVKKFMEGNLSSAEASICKLAATEMQCKVADQCLQLFGGYGYMREYKISRAYVDARVQRIYGGTSEIMKELISRSFLGR